MAAVTRVLVAACVLSVALAGQAGAAPSISSVAGDTSGGGAITITGSGFGTKATAAPIKWDDFENGTNGAYLKNVDSSWAALRHQGAIYSNTESHSGSLAAYNDPFSMGEFTTNYFQYPPTDEVFVTYWVNITNADPTDYGIIKLTRITSSTAAGGGGVYNGTGDSGWSTINPRYDSFGYTHYNNGLEAVNLGWGLVRLNYDTWCRVDMYKKLSTAGVADGAFDVIAVGIDSAIHHNTMTRASGQTFRQDTVLLGLMAANVEGQFELYIDDVYIDNTRARVEIGNAATWSACTHREIQIPTAWSGTSVTVTVNQGSFANGAPVYLYVVDADGNANSAGYPVTIGGPIMYNLSVTNGSGDGQYEQDAVVAIAADSAPSGKAFGIWVGDSATVADTHAASTTVTMPAADVSLTAGYVWTYRLTVNSGTGDGSYTAGTVVSIAADPAASGQQFDAWTGDVANITDTLAANTTVTMPPVAVEITATYKAIAIPGDLNGDGFVGQDDLDIVLDQWGCGTPPADPITDSRADPSGDGFVGQDDLDIVLDHWGEALPQ